MSVAEWLGPTMGVTGVALGFALGQWDAWRRSRREAWAARTLLRLEIDDNLAEVRRYRAEAADRALEEMLPPAWTKEAWSSQLARIPAALSLVELARVRRFYARLDLVAEHHQRARTAGKDPVIQAREVAAAEELTGLLCRFGNPLDRPRSRRRRLLHRLSAWAPRVPILRHGGAKEQRTRPSLPATPVVADVRPGGVGEPAEADC